MPKALYKYISMDKDILGGTPVISGTRIPIERLMALVKMGYSTEDLKEEYPHVDAKKIQFLMAYLLKAGLQAFEQSNKKNP